MSDPEKLDDLALEAAKSSVVFSLCSHGDTVSSAAALTLLDHLKGVQAGLTRRKLHGLKHVTKADVLRVLDLYFRPLFDAQQSNVCITTNTGNVQTITEGFGKVRVQNAKEAEKEEEKEEEMAVGGGAVFEGVAVAREISVVDDLTAFMQAQTAHTQTK